MAVTHHTLQKAHIKRWVMTYQLEKQSGVTVKNESMCMKGLSTTVIIEVATLYAQGVTYFSYELMKLDPHVAMLVEEWVE